jgi:spermidine synthase
MLTQQSPATSVERTECVGRHAAAGDFQKYYFLFFFSGFPALLYQIVWQRALFAIYGVNIESVTIIVTMFMLGLGIGSLAGGWLSKRSQIPLLALFSGIEFGIALFGILSLKLFHFVATFTAGTSVAATGAITFVLLLLPTLLMGSTLPLLVEHLVRRNGNVGESVGALYCVNTFGSAAACFAAAFLLMNSLGQSGTLRVAAAINASVAMAALLLNFSSRNNAAAPTGARSDGPVPGPSGVFPLHTGAILCALIGFIALGYEMLWYRVYSFASGRSARCFAMLLGWYLAGLAYGSLAARDLCRTRGNAADAVLRGLAVAVFLGSVIGFLVAPGLAVASTHMPLMLSFPLVFIAAALLGAAFPLLSHLSIDPAAGNAGARVSILYVSNIAGCTLGSYLVGFFAMDHLSTRGVSAILLSVGLAVAAMTVAKLDRRSRSVRFSAGAAAVAAAAGTLIFASLPVYSRLYERLLYKSNYDRSFVYQHLIENRDGVIAVSGDNVVYGGGVYDGRISTSLANDLNHVFRTYALNAFHAQPGEVLVVGLSAGAWTQILANNPRVERITVIEINPGYLEFIPQHPEVASLLRNPKVQIIIDDGRRWLLAHPDRKFDAIVMNTSQHWLDHASNLLSIEFLQLVRKHLKSGGVHYYNTTFSNDALMTGATVYPYALRVGNFLAVSDSPLLFDKERWRETLTDYRIDGKPVLDLNNAADREAFHKLLALVDTHHAVPTTEELDLEYGDDLRKRLNGARLITDDNMGVEWR